MRKVTIAVTQFACSWDLPDNLDRAEALVRRAAGDGAEVILLQELFATPYFCITEDPRHFALAAPFEGPPSSPASRPSRANLAWSCRSRSSNAPARRISTPWRWSMRTGACSGATARAISPSAARRPRTRRARRSRATRSGHDLHPAVVGVQCHREGRQAAPAAPFLDGRERCAVRSLPAARCLRAATGC